MSQPAPTNKKEEVVTISDNLTNNTPTTNNTTNANANNNTNNKQQQRRGTTKFKAPESFNKSVTKGLEFAPYAKNMVNGNIYILFILGIVALAMAQNRIADLAFATIPGIYCICLSIFLYIWHFISEFDKEDKSVDAILSPKGWPGPICTVLSLFNLHAVQCVFCALASVYCFFCVQTAICGAPMVFAAILYLIAAIRRERSRKITGII
ncbi:hypothetical protein ABK040_008256 [Willaertia magna]